MARRHDENHPYMWRAVVTHHWPNGHTRTTYCGPFMERNHASNSGSLEAKPGTRTEGYTASILIQRAPLRWENVTTTTKDET
jgi:hypothetical protein